jgi:hypothetical protein
MHNGGALQPEDLDRPDGTWLWMIDQPSVLG